MSNLKISKELSGTTLTTTVEGRLDTNTAPMLENALTESIDGVTDLVLDFSNLEYISSSGLRVLLSSHKRMLKQGSMVVKNVNETIMEIFDITGFADILTIE